MPPDIGRYGSQPAGWRREMKTLNVGRLNLRTDDRAQLIETEGDEILVESAEAWRQRDRFNPGAAARAVRVAMAPSPAGSMSRAI